MKPRDIVTFVDILRILEKRSTCMRLHVAAILIKDGRIISTGWNGSMPGLKQCNETFTEEETQRDEFDAVHREFSVLQEAHAEMNAICMAAKNGISTDGTIMFCSYSPCNMCAKAMIMAGIKEIYYLNDYDREPFTKDLLEECGVKILKIEV